MRGLERVHPDRRAAVARQVRCPTGFTEGVAVDGVARLVAMTPRPLRLPEAGPPVVRRLVSAEAYAALPARIRAWLLAQAPGAELPLPAALGRLCGAQEVESGKLSGRVTEILLMLAARREIGMRAWTPADGIALRGARAVLVCATGVVLRTAVTPRDWLSAVEGVMR